jgi:DNA-binding Lrp family transcriptional regulator
MSTVGWTFLTNHTHVLVCIARDPGTTMRSIAENVGITERAVQRIVGELVEGGYLTRTRDGRRNEYRLDASAPLRHPLERGTRLEDLLAVLSPGDPATAPPRLPRR